MLMKTIFFLLSLALLSCQGGRKQDIQSAEKGQNIRSWILLQSIMLTLCPSISS